MQIGASFIFARFLPQKLLTSTKCRDLLLLRGCAGHIILLYVLLPDFVVKNVFFAAAILRSV